MFGGFLKRIHERVVAAVSAGLSILNDALIGECDFRLRFLARGDVDVVALDLHELVFRCLKDVREHVGQVVGSDDSLFVAELDDSGEHEVAVVVGKYDAQVGEVVIERGLARKLAQCITSCAAESRGGEVGSVEAALGIAIGVNTSGLGIDVAADDGCVGRKFFAGKCFDHIGKRSQAILANRRPGVAVVVDRGDDLRQGGVARSFAHAVHTRVDTACASLDRCQAIRCGQPVVIMAVVLEIDGWPSRRHESDVARDVGGSEDAEGVREIDARDA